LTSPPLIIGNPYRLFQPFEADDRSGLDILMFYPGSSILGGAAGPPLKVEDKEKAAVHAKTEKAKQSALMSAPRFEKIIKSLLSKKRCDQYRRLPRPRQKRIGRPENWRYPDDL